MPEATSEQISAFITRWQTSGAAERANYQMFLSELCDVGHSIDLYAEFTCTGGQYERFPDPVSHRITLPDLHRPEIRARLRAVWLDPHSLDPSKAAAKVTRDIADRLATLAKSIEADGHDPQVIAGFLQRCLFTMFAEDIGLLPENGFKNLLDRVRPTPGGFPVIISALWKEMATGTHYSALLFKEIAHFNGGLFQNTTALPLSASQLHMLADAAATDWSGVEPSIFGTLLTRALDASERHKLGAEYPPAPTSSASMKTLKSKNHTDSRQQQLTHTEYRQIKNHAATKKAFTAELTKFAANLWNYVAGEHGQWAVKGFIDIYRNVFTVSSDTKIISKILEIHIFPQLLAFAEENGYSIVLAEKQNWYPDLSFVNKSNPKIKFAVDLKTSYRDPDFLGHVNGFTLGSHGAYFKDRESTKNIQFPYSDYSGHYCLGVIYTRILSEEIDETRTYAVKELGHITDDAPYVGSEIQVPSLRSITSVVRDFEFFVCEKWQIASDRQGSGNTANIGAITWIEDIRSCCGVFSKLGEKWFDEYWMNHGSATMLVNNKAIQIKKLCDFMDFKGADKSKIVPVRTKTKNRKMKPPCE